MFVCAAIAIHSPIRPIHKEDPCPFLESRCAFFFSSPQLCWRKTRQLRLAAKAADQAKSVKLDHFDPSLADKTLDPCDDFYKYSCSKWIAANPIPSDQSTGARGAAWKWWNDNVLRETLEACQQKRFQTQRRTAESRRLLVRLHGRKRH